MTNSPTDRQTDRLTDRQNIKIGKKNTFSYALYKHCIVLLKMVSSG